MKKTKPKPRLVAPPPRLRVPTLSPVARYRLRRAFEHGAVLARVALCRFLIVVLVLARFTFAVACFVLAAALVVVAAPVLVAVVVFALAGVCCWPSARKKGVE